jgi:hypothetical protein
LLLCIEQERGGKNEISEAETIMNGIHWQRNTITFLNQLI